jgi:hypothetical protein
LDDDGVVVVAGELPDEVEPVGAETGVVTAEKEVVLVEQLAFATNCQCQMRPR